MSDPSASDEYPAYRCNFLCLIGDYIFFGGAMAFINLSTVLPSFVNRLTDSAPLVGLVSTLSNGAWLLPQLIAANYLSDKPHKKPYMLIPAAIGRPVWWVLAGLLLLVGDRYPALLLGGLYLTLLIFMSTDALASVAWFDILSKAIPPVRRGRLIGGGQVGSALLGLVAGWVVSTVLSESGPPFPMNYAVLFILAGLCLTASLLCLSLLREPAGPVQDRRPSWREFLPQLGAVLRQDHNFRRLIATRLLAGASGMALPFFVVYATGELGFPKETVGLFLSAQVVGSILSAPVFGRLNERSGNRVVVVISTGLSLSMPLLALFLPLALPRGSQALLYAYALIFALNGAIMNTYMTGFQNFVLEMAPPEERPFYVGLANTIGGITVIAPILGGWLLELTSYPLLFAVTSVILTLGIRQALRLREPRSRA